MVAQANADALDPRIADLPNIKPSADLNDNLLSSLEIMLHCKERDMCYRIPAVTITGHVDSGKSTTTVCTLYEMGSFTDKQIEDAAATPKGLATLVEAGKEAKERGVTIETRVWRVALPNTLKLKDQAKIDKAKDMLQKLGIQFEEKKEGEVTIIDYSTPLDIVDCPGHKDYLPNTCGAITEAQEQLVLFPGGSGAKQSGDASTTDDNDAAFGHAISDKSTSLAHARLGIANRNSMVFCLSKCDSNSSDTNSSRVLSLVQSIKKTFGIKEDNMAVIPIANASRRAHNIVRKSDADFMKFFNGQTFVKYLNDYRDANHIGYPTKISITSAFDSLRYRLPQVCIEGTHYNRGCCVAVKKIVNKAGHGNIIVGVVISGALRVGAVLTSCEHDIKLSVVTMEQFRKSVNLSATGAHIGIKLKVSTDSGKKGLSEKSITEGDLLYCDYPKDQTPKCVQYVKASMLFFKSKDNVQHDLGSGGMYISGSKHAVTICRVVKMEQTSKVINKQTKKREIELSKNSEGQIGRWSSGSKLKAWLKFSTPECLVTINQCVFGASGPYLTHKNPTAAVKIVKLVDDKAKIERTEADLKKYRTTKKKKE